LAILSWIVLQKLYFRQKLMRINYLPI
jgi:hypothetical protein